MSPPGAEGPSDALPQSDLVYQAAFERSELAAWILSTDAAILAANQRARAIMAGATPWRGSQAAISAFPRANSMSRAALALALASATERPPPRAQVEDVDAAGNGRVHEVTIRPVLDASGEPLFLVLEARNVTDVRRVTAEANAARIAAEAADRAKSAFLARMSHEMRTPLHAVLGFAELLRADPTFASGDARESLEQIQTAGERMLALVNDVLELARLESGGLAAETTPTDLPRLLRDLTTRFAEAAAARDLEFRCEVDSDLPAALLLDAGRLRRLLGDLLDNAVRFTTAGEVRLVAVWQPEGQRERVGLRVEDTGPGIPLADQERLLSPFESGRRGHSGTGLGLALARRLVLLMGGTFALHSSSSGTRIELEIPAPRFEPGTAADLVSAAVAQEAGHADPSLAACRELPERLRENVVAAAQVADYERLKREVAAVATVDPAAAAALANAVDRFDYRGILAALSNQPAAASSSENSGSPAAEAGSDVRRVSPSDASGESGREK